MEIYGKEPSLRAFKPVVGSYKRQDRTTTVRYERELAPEELADILEHGKALSASALLFEY